MQDPYVWELMIGLIDKQDGNLENDISLWYGDGDEIKWSENTIREEVRQTATDAKKEQKKRHWETNEGGTGIKTCKQIPEG